MSSAASSSTTSSSAAAGGASGSAPRFEVSFSIFFFKKKAQKLK